jgi:hypothetical protein
VRADRIQSLADHEELNYASKTGRNAMLTAEAQVQTGRPDRYLAQFCRHASQTGGRLRHRPRSHGDGGTRPEMRHVEWSETNGSLILNWGQCTLQATPGTLTLRAAAADAENLIRIQDLVTERLEKFGRRDHLTVAWRRTSVAGNAASDPAGG